MELRAPSAPPPHAATDSAQSAMSEVRSFDFMRASLSRSGLARPDLLQFDDSSVTPTNRGVVASEVDLRAHAEGGDLVIGIGPGGHGRIVDPQVTVVDQEAEVVGWNPDRRESGSLLLSADNRA